MLTRPPSAALHRLYHAAREAHRVGDAKVVVREEAERRGRRRGGRLGLVDRLVGHAACLHHEQLCAERVARAEHRRGGGQQAELAGLGPRALEPCHALHRQPRVVRSDVVRGGDDRDVGPVTHVGPEGVVAELRRGSQAGSADEVHHGPRRGGWQPQPLVAHALPVSAALSGVAPRQCTSKQRERPTRVAHGHYGGRQARVVSPEARRLAKGPAAARHAQVRQHSEMLYEAVFIL